MFAKSRIAVLGAAAVLAGGSAVASSSVAVNSPKDPAGTDLRQTTKGVGGVVGLLQKNAAAHAGEGSAIQMPSVFLDYDYAESNDRRAGGFDSQGDYVTLGWSFLAAGETAFSVMLNYGNAYAEDDDGADSYTKNYGATFSASRNTDWLLYGVSTSLGMSDTSAGRKLESTSFTIAPFVGAFYRTGSISMSTIPTYMLRWLDDDQSKKDDGTFVWINTLSYQSSEKITLGVSANFTGVTHVEDEVGSGDRTWLTVGPKVSYVFSPAFSAYASYTKALFSRTYESQDAMLGVNYDF